MRAIIVQPSQEGLAYQSYFKSIDDLCRTSQQNPKQLLKNCRPHFPQSEFMIQRLEKDRETLASMGKPLLTKKDIKEMKIFGGVMLGYAASHLGLKSNWDALA